MKVLCYSFFVWYLHSDIKSLNKGHVANYDLGFSLLFNTLFVGLFSVKSILKNVEKSVNNFLFIDAGYFCAISADCGTFE